MRKKSLHPGLMLTELQRHWSAVRRGVMVRFLSIELSSLFDLRANELSSRERFLSLRYMAHTPNCTQGFLRK